MESPNINSAMRSPSSDTTIWRTSTSSGESRVTTIFAAPPESFDEICGGMAARSGVIAGGAQLRLVVAGKNGVWRIGNIVTRNIAPEAFEVVEAARLFAEDVHDKTTEIEQRPIGGTAALAMRGLALQFLIELFFDRGTDRLHLRRAVSSTQHEIFRKSADATEVEHRDGRGFLVLHGFNCKTNCLGKIFHVHRYRPCL